MKKIFKVLIALVVIAGIALGVYFIFGRKINNTDIYKKINHFNNGIVVENVNVVSKVDETLANMIKVIENKGFEIETEKQYLTVYVNAVKSFEYVKETVKNYGLFVNKENASSYINALSKAANNLEKIYLKGYEYLKNNYFNSTNDDAKEVYISNFYNIFKGALAELNNMYFNAGKAIIKASKNLFDFNIANKLKTDYYVNAVSIYVKEYLSNSDQTTITIDKIETIKSTLGSIKIETYIENKLSYDGLFNNLSTINVMELARQDALGTIETFIGEIVGEKQKSNAQDYYNLVIRG